MNERLYTLSISTHAVCLNHGEAVFSGMKAKKETSRGERRECFDTLLNHVCIVTREF